MSDLNQCQFIGRLGQDPELRYTQQGKPVANLSLAVSEKWKDQSGAPQEKTEWVRIVAFGKLAEVIGQWIKKGSQVFISGRLASRKWQDQNGQDRYTTEIVAENVQMLGGRSDNRQSAPPAQAPNFSKSAPNSSGSTPNIARQPAQPMQEPDFSFDGDIPL